MDFLDPAKQRRHHLVIIVGYMLITIALGFGIYLLFNAAGGFGLDKNGKVIQNGLVFAATTPGGAEIRINGVLDAAKTDARLSLQSGDYHISFTRDGYRPWQRSFTLDGGDIVRLDYAFLFPTKLTTTSVKTYDSAPGLATQSPDRRWLLVQQPGSDTNFDMFDLKNPKQAPTVLSLPATVVTAGANDSWALGEWSTDNEHMLLNHTHDGKVEFVLVDRTDSAKAVNLNTTFGMEPTQISLADKKYDRYYIFDAVAQTVRKAQLETPVPEDYLSNVLAYKSYGSDVMLYASSKTATDGKVGIVLRMGDKSYFIREVNGGTKYLLNLAKYSGSWYVAVGGSSENKVYVYRNPHVQLSSPLGVVVPVSVLKTTGPTQLSFSSNAQFIMDENGSQFSVYDIENDEKYQFDTKMPLDAPQPYANWMDSNRLMYVSEGKLVVFDFDHTNVQKLMPANPAYLPFFSPNAKFVDTIGSTPGGTGQSLSTTSLRTSADQ